METTLIYKNLNRIIMRVMRCICLTTNLRVFILLFVSIFLYISLVSKSDSMLSKISQYKNNEGSCPIGFEENDFGNNHKLCVDTSRYKDTPRTKLKTILMWNLAYGTKEYDIGFGQEPFYKYKCPETRCYSTSNRSYLKNVEDFDAILFHQRSFEFSDLPQKRKPHQRYIHWMQESAQYLYMDIHQLNGIFNWTMTYRQDSDFFLPYGRFHKIKDHPEGEELEKYIKEFGWKNRHLAKGSSEGNRTKLHAAWFVSHCATVARREKYVKAMQKHMEVDIYGKCSRGPIKHQCGRENEEDCYKKMEENYKFYLSFENSLCIDYITEKYFNIFKYNVIPVSYSGVDFKSIAPPHSSISAMDFLDPKTLVKYLDRLNKEDNLYAEYFWWKDFYVVRNSMEDRAQAYCDLCAKLNDPTEPKKVYDDMYKWWVSESRCKKLKSSKFGS